jgi:hypothetical protein
MNPDNSPFQDQTDRQLRVLPSVPAPKRRCKTHRPAAQEEAGSVIVPFYAPMTKPMRFTRSGQPFQVWKEPKPHHLPARRPDPRLSVSELLQSYARSMALLLSWRLHHSP